MKLARSFETGSHLSKRDRIATRRENSLFSPDVAENRSLISEKLRGQRVLIVGGAGSIGSQLTRIILGFSPAAVHVVDQNENSLVELVRELRGLPEDILDVDFQALPLDYGSPLMARLLQDAECYNVVLNFAALKHVRSEKDIYSALQMIDTNVVRHVRFLRWLHQYGHSEAYFAISTDKAANPRSLMGASKRLMEGLIFSREINRSSLTTSARFANVAFSDGSLLHGFTYRLQKGQPLAIPRDTLRYFISHQEAGELCLLAATLVPDQHIAIPKLDPWTELQPLESIAVRFLENAGYEPKFYEDEAEAKRDVAALSAGRRWPVILTPLDTSGEKPYEQFAAEGEKAIECGLHAVLALKGTPVDPTLILERLENWINDPASQISKRELVEIMGQVVHGFRHIETGRSLDQRF